METTSVHDLADNMLEDYYNGIHTCSTNMKHFCGACDLHGILTSFERNRSAFNYAHMNAGLGQASPYEALRYAKERSI